MSLKKVEQVKKDKGFKIFDLIVYGVLAVLIIAAFIAVFTTRDESKITGVRITVKAETVFEYTFGGKPEYKDFVTAEEDGSGITVTVSLDGDKNIIYIDKSAKSVVMKEANCKGKQCLYFAPITTNADMIYCSPHALRVEPIKPIEDDPIIIF